LDEDVDDRFVAPQCSATPDISCVEREAGGCSRWVFTEPECDESEGEWRCPVGGRLYEADPSPSETCLPFHSDSSPVSRLRTTGIPVETSDGRCLWVMQDEGVPSGPGGVYPAVYLSRDMPFGTCPQGGDFVGGDTPTSVMDVGELGEDALIALGDSIRYGGMSWLYYRQWVLDTREPFGARKLGTRIAVFDESTEHFRFLDGFVWHDGGDFGDSALLVDGVPTIVGCFGQPVSFTFECYLTRYNSGSIVAPESYEYYSGFETWTGDNRTLSPVFAAGPHRSSVRFHHGSGRYVLVYARGFGTSILYRTSTTLEGPWSTPEQLVMCDLPADDAGALCGYPMLHPELADPMRPNELVVSYDIATLGPDGSALIEEDPVAYWPRLVRVELP